MKGKFFSLSSVVIAFLGASLAYAESATITCDAVTKYTDDSIIDKPVTYTLYGRVKPATSWQKLATAPTCLFLRENLQLGTLEWTVTAFVEGAGESDITLSRVASKTVTAPAPVTDRDGDGVPDTTDRCPDVKGTPPTGCSLVPPPQNIIVTEATAYEIKQNTGGTYSATRIGIVPLGTSCGPETRKVGSVSYNRIDLGKVDLINWPAKIPPAEVFARC